MMKNDKGKIKIMFVCHGNICRSTMAEFLMKYEVERLGIKDKFVINSSATSFEAIGMRVHRGTAEILDRYKIDYSSKRAAHLEKSDYQNYDYIILMDEQNLANAKKIIGNDVDGKVFKLLDFTDYPRDVADPWYTHNFEQTRDDVLLGINGFLNYLTNKGLI